MRRGAGIENELASIERSIEIVCECGKNERVPYGEKGVDGRSSGWQGRGRPRLGWMDGVRWPWTAEELRWRLCDNARKIGKSAE